MSELFKLLDNRDNGTKENIHTALLCRIISFDPQLMQANIEPLEKGLPVIQNVPVATTKAGPFFIRVPYQKDDLVIVVFSERDIDKIMPSGKKANGISERMHSIDDAIIIGGITAWSNPLPAENANDLIIMHRSENAKIVITDGGDVEIKGKNVTIDEI